MLSVKYIRKLRKDYSGIVKIWHLKKNTESCKPKQYKHIRKVEQKHNNDQLYLKNKYSLHLKQENYASTGYVQNDT